MFHRRFPSHLTIVFIMAAIGLTVSPACIREASPTRLPAAERARPLEVPFALHNNHVILPVTVNGTVFSAALDTGFPAPGLALYDGPRVRALGLGIDPEMQVAARGAGGSGQQHSVQVAPTESFEIGLARFSRVPVLVLPDLGMGGYHDGIIGTSLFATFAVELDFSRRLMRLYESGSFEPPPEAREVPLKYHAGVPYTSVRITPYGGAQFEGEVHVDLGASHAISLNAKEVDGLDVPDGSVATILGRGLSGPIRGHVGRIAKLEIGGVSLDSVVTSFPAVEHQNPRKIAGLAGNLGTGVLKRFTTVFNYSDNKMWLTPNSSTHAEFRYDRSGLRFSLGDRLEVVDVIEGSPAALAGIRKGDVLEQLEGRSITGADYDFVKERLMGNGSVDVRFSRGETTFGAAVVLRDLLPADIHPAASTSPKS